MVKKIQDAINPSESEINSLDVVAKVYENKNWTIVLRDPIGGKGGTGGSTSDIAIYNSISDNYRDSNPTKTIDVYTPLKKTKSDKIAENVRSKLSQQTEMVCLDLVNTNQKNIYSICNAIKAMLNKHNNLKNRKVIVHSKKTQIKTVSHKKILDFND